MTDRPIIFSAPMVRALLDGRKTQTRRLASSPLAKCQPGDRLWVRESFGHVQLREIFSGRPMSHIAYRAGSLMIEDYGKPTQRTVLRDDHFVASVKKWLPSIHMPRLASRITLTVTAVRRQRLHDIGEADAIAEGAERLTHDGAGGFYQSNAGTHRCGFAGLWTHLHGAAAWDANPEIVALTFTADRRNIDQGAST